MTKPPPLVSVLYPTYNVERFVADAIESVQAQTFTDWEIVASDDASTDTTVERLRAFASDDRIRIVEHTRNVGMTANWNQALGAARGSYVVKLDGDDAYRPETLALLLRAIAGHEDVVGAGVRTLLCDTQLNPLDGLPADDDMARAGIDPYADVIRRNDEWLGLAVRGTQLWHSCAFMVRRVTLESIGGFDEGFGCASDTELLLRLLALPGSFAHLSYPGVLYRRVAGSVSDVYRKEGWLRWEGLAANLRAMSGLRERRRLSNDEWRAYVLLWIGLQELRRSGGTDAVRERALEYVKSVPPPPAWRLAAWKLRLAGSKLARGRDPV